MMTVACPECFSLSWTWRTSLSRYSCNNCQLSYSPQEGAEAHQLREAPKSEPRPRTHSGSGVITPPPYRKGYKWPTGRGGKSGSYM